MSRLLEQYNNKIREDLKSKLGLSNLLEVPKIKKLLLIWELVKVKKIQNL